MSGVPAIRCGPIPYTFRVGIRRNATRGCAPRVAKLQSGFYLIESVAVLRMRLMSPLAS